MRGLRNFLVNEGGTETVEWAVMAGLILAAMVTAVTAIGAWANGKFQTLKPNLGP